MTIEKLLSSETFIELFSKNEFERIEAENKLFIQARQLGVEKQFKQTLKKYEKSFKEKIPMQKDLKLPKCKYDIENYNFGKYQCTINGIIDTKTDYKFSYIPVLPVERYINEETGKEKVKIIFYKEKRWNDLIVDKSQISISQKLLLLSDYGLDVNSENARYYINYFAEIMNLNDITKLSSVSRLGWQGDYFIPYDTKGIYDGGKETENLYNAISSKGNYQLWLETIKELRKNKIVKVLMGAVLASPLIEKLSLQPYIINLWSSLSGNGKTLLCMTVMSIWGNPETGALRLSSNSTQNYCASLASFLRNITCYFDELQIIKNTKSTTLENLIMDLCNGTERGRLNKNSQLKDVKVWYNNFLFTNNDKMVEDNSGEQVYNRVIDIEINQKIFENPYKIADIIKKNYGFFGKDFIKEVKNIGFNKIKERYNELCKQIIAETNITDKQANSLISIIVADEIVVNKFFEDEKALCINDVKEYINNKDEIKTSIKAKNYIIDIINLNIKKFDDSYNYNENWGIKTDYFYMINFEVLKRELKKGSFEFDTVKKDWAEMEFLEKNSAGRYVHQTTVKSTKGNYVKLKI